MQRMKAFNSLFSHQPQFLFTGRHGDGDAREGKETGPRGRDNGDIDWWQQYWVRCFSMARPARAIEKKNAPINGPVTALTVATSIA